MGYILANYYCVRNFGGGYQIDVTADFVNRLIKARDNILSKFKKVECVVFLIILESLMDLGLIQTIMMRWNLHLKKWWKLPVCPIVEIDVLILI